MRTDTRHHSSEERAVLAAARGERGGRGPRLHGEHAGDPGVQGTKQMAWQAQRR